MTTAKSLRTTTVVAVSCQFSASFNRREKRTKLEFPSWGSHEPERSVSASVESVAEIWYLVVVSTAVETAAIHSVRLKT